jgi:hypothetical protein
MREAFGVEYLLVKDAQSSHSKSWDIPLRNVKTSKEIDERFFGNLKFSDNFQSENVTIYAW